MVTKDSDEPEKDFADRLEVDPSAFARDWALLKHRLTYHEFLGPRLKVQALTICGEHYILILH